MEEIYFRVHVQMVQWVQRVLSAKVSARRRPVIRCG